MQKFYSRDDRTISADPLCSTHCLFNFLPDNEISTLLLVHPNLMR